jgi:chitin synthase
VALLYQSLWWPELTETVTEKREEMEKRARENDVTDKNRKKLKLFTCFKHLNGKKLSSHLWFFEGFCRYLKPEFIVLLDVGTKPGS